MAAVSSEPVSTLPPLVLEAQRLMSLSVNKIVASRSRKGGVSLHRNLLVAGVLFRARDALLAAGGKMMSQSPPSNVSSASSGTSPSSEATQQQQNPDPTSNDSCRTSTIPSSSPPSADCQTPSAEISIVSSAAETKPCPHREVPVDTDDSQMDVEFVGKENVPPTTSTLSPSTSEFSKSSSPETETTMTSDKAVPSQQGAPVSRKRSQSGSSTSCPIVEKSSRVVLSSELSSEDERSSSVPVCVGHSSSKIVTSASSSRQSPSSQSQSCSSSSLNSRGSISVINPVVYVNRVDVAFCSTSGISGGVIGPIRPVLVVQVV